MDLHAHMRKVLSYALAMAALVRCGGLAAWRGPRFARRTTRLSSRSTATVEDSFADPGGAARRRERLDAALKAVGFDAAALEDDARLAGSAALRTYRSFVLPKSAGALANAEQPRRAETVANQVAYLAREARAADAEWLVNVDRSAAARAGAAPPHDLHVVLDGLRSGENVGNILRTAEAAGAASVYCCGTTPRPPTAAVLKAACNAAPHVDVRAAPSALDAVEALKADGVAVYAVETTRGAAPLYGSALPRPLALVFGNELVGVDPDVIAACDGVLCLPTFGVKNSLNVATCAGILIYDVVRRWQTTAPGD